MDMADNPRCQVVIVGAGISGLSAARHLLKNDVFNIIVLEATDKAGGRIYSKRFGESDSSIIELGAQWIHGEQNELCQIIKASNHRHCKTSWEGKGEFLCPNGVKIENEVVDEVLGWIEDSIEQVEGTFTIETKQAAGSACQSQQHELSMGEYLLQNFHTHLKENDIEEGSEEYKKRMALFQWGMSFQRIDNSCNRMNDVSLYRWSEFVVNPGENYNNFKIGAQSFIDEVLVGNLLQNRIRYNRPVEKIDWGAEESHGVTVSTRSGETICADTVIVTCSIGFLKSNLMSMFTPLLPERHTQAIQSTGFGPVTKIFVKWDKPWWPADLKGFQLVWPQEYIDCCDGSTGGKSMESNWHKTITGFDPVLENDNVLLAWLGGPEAAYAESLSSKEIMTRCAKILRDFTGVDVPDPESVAVSKWNTNEFFEGAYSFRSVDGDNVPGDICAILSDPIIATDAGGVERPAILLAGEALSKSHYSTLHGAYESGIAQATKLLQYLQLSPANNIQAAKMYQTSDNLSSHQIVLESKTKPFAFPVAKNIQVPS